MKDGWTNSAKKHLTDVIIGRPGTAAITIDILPVNLNDMHGTTI